MEEKDANQNLPAAATDEDIVHETGEKSSDIDNDEEVPDTYIYLQSPSIISILIIVLVSLVCILATSLLMNSFLHSYGITRTLTLYLGFRPNRTLDDSSLTFWAPKHLPSEQPMEMASTIAASSRPPPAIRLSETERKAQRIFRNVILPCLFFLSIICGIFAFYLRRYHHCYPAWGARPKKPSHYITVELKE
jgi:H+/Cl- antiporter ClcA